ncbi:MAG: DUF3606 domain-containing protein [Pseudorhodoplanes sp.]|jgi:hypothetical protein|nr:DUF3606 domain-containing protein [Pseudorhodoplanes sp.]
MVDNKRMRGGSDRALIAVSEPYEVRYWCKKFKVTPAKLKAAVKVVGRSSKKVEAYIKLHKRKARDRTMISLKEDYEVRYWSKKFKVTPARLKSAVSEAGRSSTRVATFLKAARKKKGKKRKVARRK